MSDFDNCDICGKKAFMRCEKHNKCDKCGLTKKECINKKISLVFREEGLICDKCFKIIINNRLEEFDGDTIDQDEYIICPYCGDKYGDCWEWNDDGEYDCDDCKNKFSYSRCTTVSYSTEKIKNVERK